MADYNCKLNWINQNEWVDFARNILRKKEGVSDNVLLSDILNFDFRFEFI